MANRQYDEMLSAVAQRLNQGDPRDIALRTGAVYDSKAGTLHIESFGAKVRLSCGDWRATPELEMWHHLTLLQYLDTANGSLPGRAWIGLAEVPGGGESRGGSFDGEIDRIIARRLSAYAPETIRTACAKLGGKIDRDTRADLCAAFRFAPRYPLLLNLWFADDEFPASGKVLLNAAVCDGLGLEAAGTAAAMLVSRLSEACE